MAKDSESRRWRAKQVGMLMRAYRQAYRIRGRAGRLSQIGLLDLMGQVDEKYSEVHGHSTVARWESGTTNPSRERIEVFGRALNLSPAEIEGLMRLAGFDLDDAQRTVRSHRLEEPVDTAGEESAGASEDEVTEPAWDVSWHDSNAYARELLKFALSRFLLSGSFIVVAGGVLAWFGWNATWTLTLYVAFAVGLALVETLVNTGPSNVLRDLFFVSMFILLSIPLLQAPLIHMDPYGFFTFEGLANTPIPYLLALATNLVVALASCLIFDSIRRWKYSLHRSADESPYIRALWAAIPPVLLVFAFSLAFSSFGVLLYLSCMLPILVGVLTALGIVHDKGPTLTEQDRKSLLWTGAALFVVLSVVNGAAIVAVHLLLGWIVLPDRSLFYSWEIDYGAWGYSSSELGERLRLGALWASLASLGYTVIVVGGHLVNKVIYHRKGALARPSMAITASLVLLIGVGGLVLSGSAVMRVQPPNFDAVAEGIWLVPSTLSVGDSADIRARFRNRSSSSGPHAGQATFDMSIVVLPPSGSEVRHEVNNQRLAYNQDWTFKTDHTFDQTGSYDIRAEIYDVNGREKGWDPLHRFDVRSEIFTVAEADSDA